MPRRSPAGPLRAIASGLACALILAVPARAEELPVADDADPSVLTALRPAPSAPALTVAITRSAHLRFDVPAGATPVLRARLALRIVDPSSGPLQVRVVKATWAERSLTWLRAPRPSGRAAAVIPADATGTVVVDLGEAVAAPGSYDVVVGGGLPDPAQLAARESGEGPVLRLARATRAQERLRTTVADLGAAEHVAFDLHAQDGTRMDGLDVAADGSGGYLGVAHRETDGRFVTALYASPDLRAWTRVRDLVARASQPALARQPGGGWLLAAEVDEVEADGVRRGHLRVLRYPSLAALRDGVPDWRYDAPRTRSTVAAGFEGTPSLGEVTDTTAVVGFHALVGGHVDRNARGVLTGIGSAAPGWATRPAPEVDVPLLRLGLAGNLGDRDHLELDGAALTVVEGQRVARDFGSWSLYVLDAAGTEAARIALRTPGRSASFGNPTASPVPLPDGGRGLVLTAFVFSEGAAPGEAGPLLAVFRLPS